MVFSVVGLFLREIHDHRRAPLEGYRFIAGLRQGVWLLPLRRDAIGEPDLRMAEDVNP